MSLWITLSGDRTEENVEHILPGETDSVSRVAFSDIRKWDGSDAYETLVDSYQGLIIIDFQSQVIPLAKAQWATVNDYHHDFWVDTPIHHNVSMAKFAIIKQYKLIYKLNTAM